MEQTTERVPQTPARLLLLKERNFTVIVGSLWTVRAFRSRRTQVQTHFTRWLSQKINMNMFTNLTKTMNIVALKLQFVMFIAITVERWNHRLFSTLIFMCVKMSNWQLLQKHTQHSTRYATLLQSIISLMKRVTDSSFNIEYRVFTILISFIIKSVFYFIVKKTLIYYFPKCQNTEIDWTFTNLYFTLSQNILLCFLCPKCCNISGFLLFLLLYVILLWKSQVYISLPL